jgi:acetyltransferase-like isoleucine patch superfamily enzyme
MLYEFARGIYRQSRKIVRSLAYRSRWRGKRFRISPTSWISMRATIRAERKSMIEIGNDCEIHPFSMILSYGGNIKIGDRVSLNPFSIIYGHGGIEIGSDVRIAASVTIIPANHIPPSDGVRLADSGLTMRGIKIGDNVWIGTGARILDGVTIGTNAVIGAGSVVTHDVAPNSTVVCAPAKKVS